MNSNQSHTEVITLNLFMESDSDNKVNEHLCSQKNVLFSVNVAKKLDCAFSLSSRSPALQPSMEQHV